MNSTTEVRTVLVVDAGPVTDAAIILAERSTLSEHVAVTRGEWTTEIAMYGIPFELWGSGTQALWRLLSAIAYTSETVSLYEVAVRCDTQNKAVVAAAVSALCGFANPPPPKPAEPRRLAACVEDTQGDKWVWMANGADGPYWTRVGIGSAVAHYEDIAVVRVLSEGVTT